MGLVKGRHWPQGWLLMLAGLVEGCGGSGGDSEPSITAPPPQPSSAGIWSGSVTAAGANTSNAMRAIVDEDGTAIAQLPSLTFNSGGSISFTNTYMLDGQLCCGLNVDSPLTGVPPSPDQLDVPWAGRITAQVSQSQATGTVSRTGSRLFQFNLTPASELYTRPLSLATLAGSYSSTVRYMVGSTEYTFQFALNIDSAGSMVGSLTPSNCLLTGQVSIPNPNRNLFRVSNFSVSGCSGDLIFDARRNGMHRGLGYLSDDSTRPGTANNRLTLFLVMQNQTGYWPITSIVK